MFDRFQICLGYYHYSTQHSCGMGTGHEPANSPLRVQARLRKLGYKPAMADEYFAALYEPENELALDTYLRLSGEY